MARKRVLTPFSGQLKKVELETVKLQQTKEEDARLLDRTLVLFGSNLGNANNHSCKNLPILLAGGGFKHGQHLAFEAKNAPPLCNLYVTLLQRRGSEADRFGSSTGTLTGLKTSGWSRHMVSFAGPAAKKTQCLARVAVSLTAGQRQL